MKSKLYIDMATVIEKPKASADQIKIISTLITKQKVKDKDALVLGFTGMRTSSRSEMYKSEAQALITHLKRQDEAERKCDNMRKSMIAMTYETCGVSRTGSTQAERQNAIDKLNAWCVKYGHCHKKLDDHTYDELIVLVGQYKKVYKTLLNSL
jgi:hypothetical protein